MPIRLSDAGRAMADMVRDKAHVLGVEIRDLETDARTKDLRWVMHLVGLPDDAIDGVRLVLALRAAQIAEMS